MDRTEFVEVFTPFVMAMRVEFDQPTWTGYYQALKGIPLPLLERAIQAFYVDGVEFMPSAPKVLAKAETARRELMALHPYEPCDRCNHVGTLRIEGSYPPKYARCGCWARYQDRLAELGISDQPLALPPARESDLVRIGESA